jgi:DNA-binding transcriptional LysR family regulator
MRRILPFSVHIAKCFDVQYPFKPDMKFGHRQIEVFRAVMTAGQVTRAAELLHTSQPTISRELARLEQVLGFALFDRVRGRLRPTVRALALLDEVNLSYVGLDRIAATATALRGFAQGRLQVACQPALAHALLPDAIRRFHGQHPEAGVAISLLESPMLEASLSEQRFDLGLTEQHDAPVATELHTLLEADEVCVLPPDHPLASRARLTPADFEGQAFVSLAAADPYRQQIDAMFERAGVQRRLLWEVPSAVSVCALVRQGLGLAIVNPLTALASVDTGLLIRPLSVAIPFHVALVAPTGRAEHPLRRAFISAVQSASKAQMTHLAPLRRARIRRPAV